MKKHYYIFIFIFIFLLSLINTSFAFVDQRYQYWNIRFKTLNQEKNKLLSKGDTDKSIISLIGSDIKRTEDILRLFEKSLNTGTGFEKREYTKSHVRDEIKKILTPLFSLSYLEFILDNTGKKDSYNLAWKSINDLLDREIYNHFSVLDTPLRKMIIEERFSKNDWKYLVAELWIEQMVLNREELFNRIASLVEKKILNSLTKARFLISPKDLENMIESISKDILVEFNMSNIIEFHKNPLMESWCWEEKKELITRDLRNDKMILEFLKKSDIQFTLKQIHSLSRNTDELDNIFSGKLPNNYYNKIKALKENIELDKNTLPVVQNEIFNSIKKRFKKNTYYIESLEKITLSCAGLEKLTEPSLHIRYHTITLRIRNLYYLLGYSLNIEKKILDYLDINQAREINSQKKIIRQRIINALHNTNGIYASIMNSLEEKRKKLVNLKYDIKDEIANSEIAFYINSIKEYMSVYDRLSYSDSAFNKYQFTFYKILNNAETGIKSENLDQAIKLHSIIPVMSNFIPSRIKHEYNLKNYLRNKIRDKIASIRTLITFYKRKGLKIKDIQDNFLDTTAVKLRSRPEVMIGTWVMNESNFEEVDKKAVQKLNFIVKRGIWNENNGNNSITLNNIRIEDFKISLAIPEGWIEQSVSPWESENGIIKAFKSIDGNSMIYVVLFDHNNIKEASESWIKRMNSKKVYQEWGKKENNDYFRTLSDNSNSIMESYAISYDNSVLILSGTSTKDKYNFFKNKITSVFQSISSI